MNEINDPNGTATADGGEFGPQEAARLFEQTRRQTQRQFEATPPWLSLIQAVAVLAAYGTIWLQRA